MSCFSQSDAKCKSILIWSWECSRAQRGFHFSHPRRRLQVFPREIHVRHRSEDLSSKDFTPSLTQWKINLECVVNDKVVKACITFVYLNFLLKIKGFVFQCWYFFHAWLVSRVLTVHIFLLVLLYTWRVKSVFHLLCNLVLRDWIK